MINIRYVFKELSRYYREQWSKNIGDEKTAVKEWTSALNEFSLETIKDVITDIRSGKNRFCSFMPRSGEFALLCREKKSPVKLFISRMDAELLRFEYKRLSHELILLAGNDNVSVKDKYEHFRKINAKIAEIELQLSKEIYD